MHTTILKGEGPPLLMLHGWGQSHESLLPLAELLIPYATPILIDLPGFGQSKTPATAWSSFDYADAIISHLNRLDIDSFGALGHSFGGKVSMSLALRYPNKVSSLFLLASSGIRPARSIPDKIRREAIRMYGKALKKCDAAFQTRWFEDRFVPRFGSADYRSAGAMRAILVKSVNEDLSPLLDKICCPTHILWGEVDRETPLEMGKRLATLIPRATFHSFPYHDHQLISGAAAQLCARYLIDALKNQPIRESWGCAHDEHKIRT